MPPPLRPGKKIVLLSDGTGNSSAKLMRTNVWRMYEALDLVNGDQVAVYDNGVGTSSFKPFAVLGGALGWGLKRNVRNLYLAACRNYQAGTDEREADQLFAFGFSRGAFTVRVLIGLIENQGLLAGVDNKDLKRHAKWAYREYRRQFNATRGLITPLRAIRDVALRSWDRLLGRPAYDPRKNEHVRVRFLGLWDMVDAYGLPIDEMTRGWDQWVWPLSVNAHLPPANVDKICHAVAIDDERHTFHPVLFDERHQPPQPHTDDEGITQVWFAGVHSNVGGGYPDDGLALVTMRWMAKEAEKKGLRLHRFSREEWEAHADPNGPANDSRRGPGAYYRYNPRSVQKLTNDRFADVSVPRPKVHASVIGRITSARDGYAPIVLPETYAVVDGTGDVLDGSRHPLEHPTQSASRCADQERVWNLVWWRRIAYFSTVFLTVALLARPFVLDANVGGVLAVPSPTLSGVIGLLSTFLPNFASPLVEFYQERPVQLIVLGGLIAGLLWVSSQLQEAIAHRMRSIWDTITVRPGVTVTPSHPPTDWVYRLRSHRRYRDLFGLVTQKIFPVIFGFGCLLALAVVVAGTANRAAFAAASASGSTCIDRKPAVPWDGQRKTVSLPSNELCQQTGLELRQGQSYRVEIVLPDNDAVPPEQVWRDAGIRVNSPAGFSSGTHPRFLIFLPFRRVLSAEWFVPLVRIGNHVAEYHPLNSIEEIPDPSGRAERRLGAEPAKIRGFAEFTPARTGEMFLFVNDVVLPGPWVKKLYGNNHGVATVTAYAVEPALGSKD